MLLFIYSLPHVFFPLFITVSAHSMSPLCALCTLIILFYCQKLITLSVHRNLTNTSCLAIGHTAFYCHNYTNVFSHSTNIPKQRGLEGFWQYNAGNRFGRMWRKGWMNPQSLSCWRDFLFGRGDKEVKQRPWRKLVISDRTQKLKGNFDFWETCFPMFSVNWCKLPKSSRPFYRFLY